MIQTQSRISAALTLLIAGIACARPAMAQTTLFATGFESGAGYSTTQTSPALMTNSTTGEDVSFTTAPGSLFAQPDLWYVSRLGSGTANSALINAANFATISSAAAAGGTQSLLLNGAGIGSQSVRYATGLQLEAATNGIVTVSADVRVDNPSAAYGQWGINLLARTQPTMLTSTVAFASVGGQVLASTDGTDLYAAINPLTGAPLTSAYGTFNNYAVQMNYLSRTITGYFNNAQVAFVPINMAGTPIGLPTATLNFASSTPNSLAYLSMGQFMDSGSAESAYFDNFRVAGSNVAVVPEAGTLPLLLPALGILTGGIAIARRRRK